MMNGGEHLEAVKLVQEEGAVTVGDQAVEILEDKDAWRHLARLVKDGLHRAFFAHPTYKTPVNSEKKPLEG